MSSSNKPTLKVLVLNTALSLLIFFLVFYALASLLYGAFGLEKFDGKTPFDFKRCCVGSDINTVNFLSLALSYVLSTGLYLIYIRHRMWDYALTTGIIHLVVTCAVMKEFPTNWQWLVTFGLSVVVMAGLGELCCRFCFLPKVDAEDSALCESRP